MQRFESTSPSQPVRLQRVTYEGRLKNRAVPRGFADMSWSPSAEFGNGGAILPPVSAALFWCLVFCAVLPVRTGNAWTTRFPPPGRNVDEASPVVKRLQCEDGC